MTLPTSYSWLLPTSAATPSTSVIPVFPTSGSTGDVPCNGVVYAEAHFLSVFERVMASNWLVPLKLAGDGRGYEVLRAFAAVGARVSEAIERWECESFAMFAGGGAKATGTVEFTRATYTAGAVTVKPGTIVGTSRHGRMFVTREAAVFGPTDLGPIAVPVDAIDIGWEYNVRGKFIADSGVEIAGEIDTVVTMYQANAAGENDWIDATITVANILDCSGGRGAMLDALGEDRGMPRGAGEPDRPYRYRIRSLPDNISPAAVRRVLDGLAAYWGVEYDLIETWDEEYNCGLDMPSPNAGTPTYDATLSPTAEAHSNVFVMDDPRDLYPLRNVNVDDVEFRGAFIVTVRAPPCLAESGMHLDSSDGIASTRVTTAGSVTGHFACSALDYCDAEDGSEVGGCLDGSDVALQGFWRAWWDTLQALKAAGVVVGLERRVET